MTFILAFIEAAMLRVGPFDERLGKTDPKHTKNRARNEAFLGCWPDSVTPSPGWSCGGCRNFWCGSCESGGMGSLLVVVRPASGRLPAGKG
jgi:hypothetical protein